LVTNDDGYQADGFKSLIEAMRPFGNIIAVAPREAQSGMSHAITVKQPLRVHKLREEEGLQVYVVAGTPVDCVKMAINQLMPRRPDLLVSGINHGSNSSASILYSGTMAAALEGSINMIPSIGFSHIKYSNDIDFNTSVKYSRIIAEKVLANGLPKNICLNVNFPDAEIQQIAGVKICRQTMGYWREEFDKRVDPIGKEYFWLTGFYHNEEPEAQDTDEWALKHNFVSIVPVQTDFTSYKTIKLISKWDF
jgi:5'-nucleotidase